MVEVAFQSVFRLKMYQSNVFFYFLKFIFDISISKRSKNTKKIILKKKISKFHETLVAPLPQTGTEIYITP
jgi:hypothetical protein